MRSHWSFTPNASATLQYLIRKSIDCLGVFLILRSNHLIAWAGRLLIHLVTSLTIAFCNKDLARKFSSLVTLGNLRHIETLFEVIESNEHFIRSNAFV